MADWIDRLVAGAIVTDPLLPEPVEVLATVPMGTVLKLIGRALRTNQVSQKGLRLRVIAEVVPTGGVSYQEVPETRTALKELGLTDEVKARES